MRIPIESWNQVTHIGDAIIAANNKSKIVVIGGDVYLIETI